MILHKKYKHMGIVLCLLSLILILGCACQNTNNAATSPLPPASVDAIPENAEAEPQETIPSDTQPSPDQQQECLSPNTQSPIEEQPESTPPSAEEIEDQLQPPVESIEKPMIVIDAGHQGKGNSEKEPIGPGAKEVKYKVSWGTQGITTKKPEYEVNLEVALKLERILLELGYDVVMVRQTHDVNISNSERAAIANENDADAFVRIHCNGSEDHSITGAFTMCQTINNVFCGSDLYDSSRKLAECVIAQLCASTDARNMGVIETDTMSGINWCTVPVTIIEMGHMTNPEEEALLCSDDYQEKLALGIANGIVKFLTE